MKKLVFSLLLVVGGTLAWASGAHETTLTIDAAKPAGKVSPTLYGLMTEAINHSYNGGLYAELVRNRTFMDNASVPVHWSLVQGGGAAVSMYLDKGDPLDKATPSTRRAR